jgi:hypothetical protein
MPPKPKPLWRCPMCGEKFVTRNMWHSCGKHRLEAHFERSEPHVIRLFRKFARMVRRCGPVRIYPQKTRIVCQARVRFASAQARRSYLLVSFASTRRIDNPRFVRIERYMPRWYGHFVRVASERDLDADLQRWLRAAYAIGEQKHLARR